MLSRRKLLVASVFGACFIAPAGANAATATVYYTAGPTCTIPADFDSVVSIEAIGESGLGADGVLNTRGGGGGGGGAYAKITTLTALANNVLDCQVGTGGQGLTTFLENNLGIKVLEADYGRNASGATGGARGLASNSTGSVTANGGTGGNGRVGTGNSGAGGGGGAGGPLGAGGNAGNATSGGGGAGGGGGNGGGGNGGNSSTSSGAPGGNNNAGSGGGASVVSGVAGNPGTNGGGGGGSGTQGTPGGGAGSMGSDFDVSHGSGGGGGGGGARNGGAGGGYGGAGGGGGSSSGGAFTAGAPSAGAIRMVYNVRSDLVAGSGWSGATSTPGAQGNPADYGYDQVVVAAFTEPPFRRITSEHKVGVIAFHQPTAAEAAAGVTNNVNYCEASLNDGPWLPDFTIETNPNTNLPEYSWSLDPVATTDGLKEIRVICYPTTGVPLVLQGAWNTANAPSTVKSLWLNFNAGNSLPGPGVNGELTYHVSTSGTDNASCGAPGSPCATLGQAASNLRAFRITTYPSAPVPANIGGGVLCLEAGSHDLGGAAITRTAIDDWLTIEPCPGVTRAQAIISSSNASGINTTKVRFHNLTANATLRSGNPSGSLEMGLMDGIVVDGLDKNAGLPVTVGFDAGRFFINGDVTRVTNALRRFTMVLNATIIEIKEDALSDTNFAANVRVESINSPQVGGVHADTAAFDGLHDNLIFYNVDSSTSIFAQGFFSAGGQTIYQTNGAIVNSNFIRGGGSWQGLAMTKPMTNYYFLNTTWTGNMELNGALSGVLMTNSTCGSVLGPVTGLTYRNSPTCD